MYKFLEYIPLLTTVLAAVFTREIYRDYRTNKSLYLLWWTIGICNYGLGTLSESINILLGWSAVNLKFWYITGALLGGFPLAHGTMYFVMPRKFGNYATVLALLFITVAAACILLSPINMQEAGGGKLSGDAFGWQWVRYFAIPVNLYAFVFSFGSALYLANRYFLQVNREARFIGSIYISLGTLLPSVGGFYTRIGYENLLFISGLLGLGFIYWGYRIIKSSRE